MKKRTKRTEVWPQSRQDCLDVQEPGLISDNIRTPLRPYTQNPITTYEDLIQRMQHAVSIETERKKKLGLITIQKKVNEVSTKN